MTDVPPEQQDSDSIDLSETPPGEPGPLEKTNIERDGDPPDEQADPPGAPERAG